MPALALTDLANLFGMVKFYKAARAKGLKPIVGCDVEVESLTSGQAPHRALLLCQNREGYLRLCTWLTRAYAQPQQTYVQQPYVVQNPAPQVVRQGGPYVAAPYGYASAQPPAVGKILCGEQRFSGLNASRSRSI
jgi:DNA polymerase-3 subunit alpha